MPEPAVHVELRNVVKVYGTVRAVDGVSLELPKGQILSLLGPSGCGKTTTLNMIAGFLEVDGGEILLGGRPIQGVPPHRRNTAMVFQNYALFPHLSVFDNVAFGLRMRKVPAGEIARRVASALEMVRLKNVERRFPKEMSGGQQQRVALARALVVEPEVLLLDEPLSNLDAKLRAEMRSEIVDIQRRAGISTIFVTHDQEEALAISDRIAVMNLGHVEQLGSAQEIYSRPATAFVARFIGEVNDLSGRVVAFTGGNVLVELAGGRQLRAAAGAPVQTGGRVRVMVRPERVEMLSDGQAAPGTGNRLPAVVERATYLGAVTQYRLKVGEATFKVSRANRGDQTPFAPGDTVQLAWDPADTLLEAELGEGEA